MADQVKAEEMRELEQRIDVLEAEIRKWMDDYGYLFKHISSYQLDRPRSANYKRGKFYVVKREGVK